MSIDAYFWWVGCIFSTVSVVVGFAVVGYLACDTVCKKAKLSYMFLCFLNDRRKQKLNRKL